MRRGKYGLTVGVGVGIILLIAGNHQAAFAQEGGYAPPPPPPPPAPPAPDTTSPEPAPPPTTTADGRLPPRARRPRYRPSPWGRFYLGAGGGYMVPGGEVGTRFQPGGAYGAWLGWRKGWIGFEVGYLGARLALDLPDSVIVNSDNDTEPTGGNYVTYSAPDARLSHVTGDVKVFFRLFCSSTLFARFGANYTTLSLADGTKYAGVGYQYGAGLDYRIRLGFRPDLILKLRAEVLQIQAGLTPVGVEDHRNLSGIYMMLYLNLGWSPR
jgi:hypothetical protein